MSTEISSNGSGLQAAEQARQAAEAAARRAIEEAAKAATEAARKAAELAAKAAMAARSTFAPAVPPKGPDLGGSQPAPSNLTSEDLTDGQVNCLNAVELKLAADPALRASADVVFLRDTRTGPEGDAGHVLIRQGNQVWDPATEKWTSTGQFLRTHPEYEVAGIAKGEAVHSVLSATIGPDRDLAIAGSGIDPALLELDVADGTRDPKTAISEARALFTFNTGDTEVGGTFVKYQDVRSVTMATQAQTQVTANAALEAQALTTLTPDDQARYTALQTSLTGDPAAQLSLQLMLLEGRLPGEAALGGDGGNLLQQLETLSTQTNVAGLGEGAQLLGQVVREIAIPASIQQHNRSTCTVTSAAITLARENPAEYVRLIAGLASPAGTVRMANGATLTRESNTIASDDSGRTASQRLLQPALMEYGNGQPDYDNDRNASLLVIGGLFEGQTEAVMEALFGRTFTGFQTLTTGFGLGYSNANIAREAAQAGDHPILVSMFYPGPRDGHMLVLDRVEGSGEDSIYFIVNPWGRTEQMTYAEFAAHCSGVIQPE